MCCEHAKFLFGFIGRLALQQDYLVKYEILFDWLSSVF